MAKDFPEPVWPYAKIQVLYPRRDAARTGEPTSLCTQIPCDFLMVRVIKRKLWTFPFPRPLLRLFQKYGVLYRPVQTPDREQTSASALDR